jgi:hypothetical protein
MDTTFTRRPRTCTIDNTSNGRCNNNTWIALGTWLNWPGGFTGAAQPADTIRITHWPIDVRRNAAFEGLVNVNGSTMVSGVVRGNVTLRVGGTASIIDHIVYESDPNDPSKAPCTDMLGLIATQDILVVDGAMTRLRRYGTSSSRYDLQLGGGPNFLLHGFLLSSGGTVGVQNPASTVQGTSGIECRAPPDATAGRRANGGCFVHVGGAAMRTYSEYSQGNGQNAGGIIPFPVADRCQTTGRQPPGFPSIASFRVLRSLTVDASRANTEPKILALLRSLRGANLD